MNNIGIKLNQHTLITNHLNRRLITLLVTVSFLTKDLITRDY